MRSLAAQLVALAVAVPVTTATTSHPSTTRSISRSVVAAQPPRAECPAFCQARTLRRKLQSVHIRTVKLARHAALPVPPPPRLGWRRAALRTQLARQARVLGRYRAQARRPLSLRLERFEAWVCIHNHEGAWDDSGDPYWGGLQMDRGFMLAYGRDMISRHHGGLADEWTPAEQIVVAERAYATRGFAPWPNTSRSCGLR